jgi:hypothetical protein
VTATGSAKGHHPAVQPFLLFQAVLNSFLLGYILEMGHEIRRARLTIADKRYAHGYPKNAPIPGLQAPLHRQFGFIQ